MSWQIMYEDIRRGLRTSRALGWGVMVILALSVVDAVAGGTLGELIEAIVLVSAWICALAVFGVIERQRDRIEMLMDSYEETLSDLEEAQDEIMRLRGLE